MRHIALPLEVQNRMLTYFDYRLQERFYKDFEILNELGPQLKRKIKLHMTERLLKTVQLFQALPSDVITRLVDCLDSQIFLKNDVIMKAEQPQLVMFIIVSGTVALYTQSAREVLHLEDGAHFGELALILNDTSLVANIIAVETSELLALNKSDFDLVMMQYPNLSRYLYQAALVSNALNFNRHNKN
jgi:signal-transduction protein with cAMP-binding, CBS, and nucleotidyltransferase domain